MQQRLWYKEARKFWGPGTDYINISDEPMSQKLRGALKLLFVNGCVWLDDDAE